MACLFGIDVFVIGSSVVGFMLDPVWSGGASPWPLSSHFYGKERSMLMIGEAGTMNKTLLRVGEAAELLSVSRWTIYRWVEDGRLRGTKIGKSSLRIFRDSIVSLIERNDCTMPVGLARSEHI